MMRLDENKIAAATVVLAAVIVLCYSFFTGRAGLMKNASSPIEDTSLYDMQAAALQEKEALENGIASLNVQQDAEKSDVETSSTITVEAPKAEEPKATPVPPVKPASSTTSAAAKKPAEVKIASRSSNVKPTPTAKASSRGSQVVSAAKELLGKPYTYGAEGPSSFDCSGLTLYVANKFGLSLPHSAKSQSTMGKYVEKSGLQPGDFVFFTTNGKGSVSHVGIYVGGGSFIHAPESGKAVSITSMSSGYYSGRYITARRLIF